MPSVDLIRYWSKGCVGETANGHVGDAGTVPLTGEAKNSKRRGRHCFYQTSAPALSRSVRVLSLFGLKHSRKGR